MQTGSFQQSATLIGCSQSAVSLQMRRLENQVGVRLLQKNGRKLALTDAGEVLLGYAKWLLVLNDEAVQATAGVNVKGKIRLGLLQDFAETILPPTPAAFTRGRDCGSGRTFQTPDRGGAPASTRFGAAVCPPGRFD